MNRNSLHNTLTLALASLTAALRRCRGNWLKCVSLGLLGILLLNPGTDLTGSRTAFAAADLSDAQAPSRGLYADYNNYNPGNQVYTSTYHHHYSGNTVYSSTYHYSGSSGTSGSSNSGSRPGSAETDRLCNYCSGTGSCTFCNGNGSNACTGPACVNGRCTSCNGTGRYNHGTCIVCSGDGRCNICNGLSRIKCRHCQGDGRCSNCHGSGRK